jgi:hypothetical protein
MGLGSKGELLTRMVPGFRAQDSYAQRKRPTLTTPNFFFVYLFLNFFFVVLSRIRTTIHYGTSALPLKRLEQVCGKALMTASLVIF